MNNVEFELILYAGNSKSSAMEAILLAKKGDFEDAQRKLEEANEQLNLAHEVQTKLLVNNARGEKCEVDILMVHAQDHLNGALITLELVTEMIEMYKLIKEGEK
ncbi:MAG: PTS lactose/cellobiose transporter subunit IIA [Clostridium sp.]|uniref:PTS lactose/cellobiose transporter subunit IIA n=1 Tax=Clostridium sp. TaxID=1506 RepID=UPI002912BBEC|nr:PTS lactose/cellobiose transporter subunit IIA [Clostridium sp.]MDU5111004.1 PTS lactose/cellobiose transporter subunit IIA [Clostridium sp.]